MHLAAAVHWRVARLTYSSHSTLCGCLGVATFTITSTNLQSITFTASDSIPIFTAAMTTTSTNLVLSVQFTNARSFTFGSITPVAIGTSVPVVITLSGWGGSIGTGLSTSVTLKASNGATPPTQVISISSVTGQGTGFVVASSSLTSNLTLQDTAGTTYNVAAFALASWAGTAVNFAASFLQSSPQQVTSSYTLQLATADANGLASSYNGTCSLTVTAIPGASYKSLTRTVYLNNIASQLTVDFNPTLSVIPVTVTTQQTQSVTFTYVSTCPQNLTFLPAYMNYGPISFTSGALSSYSISTPYQTLSAPRGNYVPIFVYAVSLTSGNSRSCLVELLAQVHSCVFSC
jgi:hypothetical protein